jgi:hypothetical protein
MVPARGGFSPVSVPLLELMAMIFYEPLAFTFG